jgi:hypothetical protein
MGKHIVLRRAAAIHAVEPGAGTPRLQDAFWCRLGTPGMQESLTESEPTGLQPASARLNSSPKLEAVVFMSSTGTDSD